MGYKIEKGFRIKKVRNAKRVIEYIWDILKDSKRHYVHEIDFII